MPRPRCCVQRAPPPSPTAVVHEILQWGPHASIPGEGCTLLARCRSRRAHSLSPNPGRAASPICPDLIYDRHTVTSTQAFGVLGGNGNITVRNAGAITGGNGTAIQLGNGNNIIEMTGGQLNGAVATGTGADQFTWSGGG